MFYISSYAKFSDGIIKEINVDAVYRDMNEHEIYRKDFEEKLDIELARIRQEVLDYRTSAMASRVLREKKMTAVAPSGEVESLMTKNEEI